MKTKTFFLTFFTVLFLSFSSLTQNKKEWDWEWAPLGAVWMHANFDMNFENPESVGLGGSVYWFVQSVKDTVINDIACRKLEVIRHYGPNYLPVKMPDRFTYQDGGDIYFYNHNVNDFTLAFSYNLNYGDTVTWISPYFEDVFCNYYLDTILNWDVGFLSGANTPYMPNGAFFHSNVPISSYRLYYTLPCVNTRICKYIGYPESLYNVEQGRFLDYAGSKSDLFVDLGIHEGSFQRLICYYDGQVNISEARFHPEDHVPGYAQDSCVNYFYRNFINNIELSQKESNFFIFPNPAIDVLNINTQTSNFNYEIYNIQGSLIKASNKIFKGNTRFDISDLKQGVYIIHFYTKSERIVKRFIKI
jgi:hypothetical protein